MPSWTVILQYSTNIPVTRAGYQTDFGWSEQTIFGFQKWLISTTWVNRCPQTDQTMSTRLTFCANYTQGELCDRYVTQYWLAVWNNVPAMYAIDSRCYFYYYFRLERSVKRVLSHWFKYDTRRSWVFSYKLMDIGNWRKSSSVVKQLSLLSWKGRAL